MLKHGTKIWVLFTEVMWFLFEVNKSFHSKVMVFFILAKKFQQIYLKKWPLVIFAERLVNFREFVGN